MSTSSNRQRESFLTNMKSTRTADEGHVRTFDSLGTSLTYREEYELLHQYYKTPCEFEREEIKSRLCTGIITNVVAYTRQYVTRAIQYIDMADMIQDAMIPVVQGLNEYYCASTAEAHNPQSAPTLDPDLETETTQSGKVRDNRYFFSATRPGTLPECPICKSNKYVTPRSLLLMTLTPDEYEAQEKIDPDVARFSSWIMKRVQGNVRKCNDRKGRAVMIPNRIIELWKHFVRKQPELLEEDRYEDAVRYAQEVLGISASDITELFQIHQIYVDSETQFATYVLPNQKEERSLQKRLLAKLEDNLRTYLSVKEAQVIRYLFGLGEKLYVVDEIAAVMGLDYKEVIALRDAAISKLQKASTQEEYLVIAHAA